MNDNSSVKFSIVIPTYNREDFIVKTLESVFSQTYKNYEVIVVDNCSTDNTVAVLQPLIEQEKIRFIQHEKNYERARSRNTGIENATGDFLTFLDSDDFMYPQNLADAADFIKENPEVKCFQNLYELIDSEGKVLKKYEFPSINDPVEAIVAGNFMSCIGGFIDRDIYTKYRFDTYKELTGAEDWEFWLRVIGDHGVGRIEKINSAILQHEMQTVQSYKHYVDLEKGYWYLFKKFREDEHLKKVFSKYLDRIEANSYMYLATLANTNGHFDDTKRFLEIAREKDSSVKFTKRYLKIMLRAMLKKKIT